MDWLRGWIRRGTVIAIAGLTMLSACGGLRVDAASDDAPATVTAAAAPDAARLRHDLRRFRTMGTVLHVAAHPDDENTRLIAYLARGRALRTGYLSITRGDGGQNLLGPQLGPLLGIARTQELLAARRIDGGRQFFTRAIDFGFSKDYREALAVWGHEQVLGDVVRIIREFRPDVIVTRFSPEPGGTHGHHTASAVLALEAFRLAGDSSAYPEQLRTLEPWQPRRIFVNRGASGTPPASSSVVEMAIAGVDPVAGDSFAVVAAASRGMHKTQGFDQIPPGRFGGAARRESFLLLAGEPAEGDILAGVDTTWNRIPGGAAIARLAATALEDFDVASPAATVPALLEIRRELAKLPRSPLLAEKRLLLDSLIQNALGLTVTSTARAAELLAGEAVGLHHVARHSASVPLRWVATRYPDGTEAAGGARILRAGETAEREGTYTVPAGTPLSEPYWLRAPATTGFYTVTEAQLIGRPENPPLVPVEHVFEVSGERFVVPDRAVAREGEAVRDLVVVAPVALTVDPAVAVLRPGTTRDVAVLVSAARARVSGSVRLQVPAGWSVDPAAQPFALADAGDTARVRFTLRAPAGAGEGTAQVLATVAGDTYGQQHIEVDYAHLPLQVVQPDATLRVVSVQLATRGQRVGYIPGAGDEIPGALRQMGYEVTELTPADLNPGGLARFDAVVLGIRLANVRDDLDTLMPMLFDYARAGGTVIQQYSQTDGPVETAPAPFPLTISRGRVTEEDAAVTFLAPDHPALNAPNRITMADFRGWLQEQGTYYASEWGPQFTPILASSDTGEAPLHGGLLVAPYGDGYWVYTGLAFFRQLPAGVPGAYRLFANLVSLGN